METIVIFCILVATALLGLVGLFFNRIKIRAVWLTLFSIVSACLLVTWVYYPRSYSRNYLDTTINDTSANMSLSNLVKNKKFALGAAARTLSHINDKHYTQLYTSVTPENALKLEGVLVDIDKQTYDFTQADAMVDQALAKGLRVRGHALVFGKASDMFKAPDLDAWLEQYPLEERKPKLTQFMLRHISIMLTHYHGRIHEWDVVNEVLDLFGNGGVEENVFYRYVGPEYIRIALNAARQADPTIKIYINEQLNNYTDERAEAFYKLIETLVKDNIPLDGIGLQAHSLYALAPPVTLNTYMQRFGKLGLSIEITELEARLKLFGNAQDPYLAQGEYYRDIVRQCLELAACNGVTFWGYTDSVSWMNDLFYLFPKPNEPYLLDSNMKPKPAVSLLSDLFR